MVEKENMENIGPDSAGVDTEGFEEQVDVTSGEDKTYVPYEEEAPYEASPDNVMNLGHIGSLDELDESLAEAAEEEEDEEKDKTAIISGRMIKIGAMMMLTTVVFILGIIAWFASSKEVGNQGMGVKVKGRKFDLITMSDASNKNGAYYDPYHMAISDGENDGYDVWLVDDNSNMNNYQNDGAGPATLGIEPGSNGVISFYIKPYEDVTVNFAFQTIGYQATETLDENDQTVVTMTELPSGPRNPACYLNGHILLFEHRDTVSGYYTGLIPADITGRRSFSREFEVEGSFNADTDNDSSADAYKVDIYWVWPETLDTLIYDGDPTDGRSICDKNAAVGADNKNDYQKIVDNICTYPKYYIHGYDAGTEYTEDMLLGRNAMYNDADQEIGMNVDYILLRLKAD